MISPTIQKPVHPKTRLRRPVFEWCVQNHAKTEPFANRTAFYFLKTGLVWYLNGYCKYIFFPFSVSNGSAVLGSTVTLEAPTANGHPLTTSR